MTSPERPRRLRCFDCHRAVIVPVRDAFLKANGAAGWLIGLNNRSDIVDLCPTCAPKWTQDGGNHFHRKD